LAATLHGLGRREEALAAAERAVVLDPLSAIINVTLGDVRAGVGRFDDALVAYAQAIEVEPTIAVAYAYIGDVHAFGFGRLDAAMAWYEKATTLDPGAPGILASPARAHRRCTIDPKFKSPMVGRFPHPRGTDSPPVMAKK
jgi:tetratricopeptide (TPR) repeat protein